MADVTMQPKILVVDDEALILSAVERALLKVGYRVFSARNLEQLGMVLAEAPFDLLITDIHLVDDTVDHLIQRVREGSPRVRILLMSGGSNKGRSYPFIEKPFSISGLRQLVRNILDEP
jgi:DNA-binding NtrC family response regulator